MQSDNPWPTVGEVLNRHVTQDPDLGRRLATLSKMQAQNARLAFKIEEGRMYPLRQETYTRRLRAQLEKPRTQPMW